MKTFAPSHVQPPIHEVSPETLSPHLSSPAAAGRVLLVDADEAGAAPVARLLADHGFAVSVAAGAEAADAELLVAAPDLVILETALPGEDGLSLCRRLALRGGPPILILAARCEAMDRIIGLELGADDVIGKACHPLELVARVRAVLRRRAGPAAPAPRPDEIEPSAPAWGGWRLHVLRRDLTTPGGERLPLSPTEFRIFAAFLQRPDGVLSRDDLRRLAFRGAHVADRSIDVMVCRLRRKLEQRTGCRLLTSVHGVGYTLSSVG